MTKCHKRYSADSYKFEMDDLAEILPGLSEPQQRVLDVAIRYWRHVEEEPRDINRLRDLLGDDLDTLRQWDELSDAESRALNSRSAAVASIRLKRLLLEAQAFYSSAMSAPTDVSEMVGRHGDHKGRLVIIDLQGLSDTAKQVITALVSSEILRAASSRGQGLRPCFIVYEEGHTFAPAGQSAISLRIIRKVAAEGRKFGVGFAIVSQRPSKLDADVTSQCNTIIAMRLKNPDDQRFILRVSDMFSQADVNELPSLSTGEALVSGRSIPAPLLVRVGLKALVHGGQSQMCSTCGGISMAELEVLRREFASLSLADEHFPIWRQWGVEDTSVAVHSLGLSYLLTIGQRAGFAACCEFPVDPSVRADCVWWQKDSHSRTPNLTGMLSRYSTWGEFVPRAFMSLRWSISTVIR